MGTNPAHAKLGLEPGKRAVIFHFDDLGMFQASIPAYDTLLKRGVVKSGSVMAPCPWFPAVAERFGKDPRADLGLHLTLNSEWKEFRWAPLCGRNLVSSLIDNRGYFFPTVGELHEKMVTAEAKAELEAQLATARAFGLQLSHIDTHMGSVQHHELIPVYVEMLVQHKVVGLVLNINAEQWELRGLSSEAAQAAAGVVRQLAGAGIPLVDHFAGLPSAGVRETFDQRLNRTLEVLRTLQPGITHFALHPSTQSDELLGIGEDLSSRVREFEVLCSDEFSNCLEAEGIRAIAYRDLL